MNESIMNESSMHELNIHCMCAFMMFSVTCVKKFPYYNNNNNNNNNNNENSIYFSMQISMVTSSVE